MFELVLVLSIDGVQQADWLIVNLACSNVLFASLWSVNASNTKLANLGNWLRAVAACWFKSCECSSEGRHQSNESNGKNSLVSRSSGPWVIMPVSMTAGHVVRHRAWPLINNRLAKNIAFQSLGGQADRPWISAFGNKGISLVVTYVVRSVYVQ